MNIQSYPSNKQSQYNSNLQSYNSNLSQQKSGPKSQRSVNLSNNGSIKSNNAVQGSIKGSIISYNSSQSKKTQKSLLSLYPQLLSKQPQSIPSQQPQQIPTSTPKQQKLPQTQQKHSQQPKPAKKLIKASWYIDQDFYYSSQFKRNFVKGMLSLTIYKNIQDINLLLREIAPTIMVRSCDTIVWISAYLLIFKIQHKLRRNKLKQQQLLQLIQDNLIQFMLKNKDIKKIRLMKIVIYLLRQLPVNKPKIMSWFQDFIRKNKDRLIGIDITKYIDIHTIHPVPIDYNKLNKTAIIKAKNIQKQKQKQKKKQTDKQKIKQKQILPSILFDPKLLSNISMHSNNNIINNQSNCQQNNMQISNNQILSQCFKDNNQSNSKNKINIQKKQNIVQPLIKQQNIQNQQNYQLYKPNQNKPSQKIKAVSYQQNPIIQSKKTKPPIDKQIKPKPQQLLQLPQLIPPKKYQQLSTQSYQNIKQHSVSSQDHPIQPQKQQPKQQKNSQQPSSYSNSISRPKLKNPSNFIQKHDSKQILTIQKLQPKNSPPNRNPHDNQKSSKQLYHQLSPSNPQPQSTLTSNQKLPQKSKIKPPIKTKNQQLKSSSSIINIKQQIKFKQDINQQNK